MRGILKFTAATIALITAPLAARSPTNEQIEVMQAVDAFFAALRNEDRTALAQKMVPDGMIFVHSRMQPDAPRVDVVSVSDHLARWATQSRKVDELMYVDTVLVDGDMAQVWGPYYFTVDARLTHCGINSLSMVKTEAGWKVANTSFTMEPPQSCGAIVAEVNSQIEFAE